MSEAGPPRLGKHYKRQRVAGLTAPGVVLAPKSVSAAEESIITEVEALWRRFKVEDNRKELGPGTESEKSDVDMFEERDGLKLKEGNRLTLLIPTPIEWDDLIIPLVAEASAINFVSRLYNEGGAFGNEQVLYQSDGMKWVTKTKTFLTSGTTLGVVLPNFSLTVTPHISLRFFPEGGPFVPPNGFSPQPYTRWWEHDERPDNPRELSNNAFAVYENEALFPPAFDIPVSWVRSPWLCDCLMVGEGNCVPPSSLGKGEHHLIEKWEEEHGPVSPAVIAAVNAMNQEEAEGYGFNAYQIAYYYGKLQELNHAKEANLCFKEPSVKHCEEFGEELAEIEGKIAEAQFALGKLTWIQMAEAAKAERKLKGPWMNGVEKWGYKLNLHKPSMFPGVDLTKQPGVLMVEIYVTTPGPSEAQEEQREKEFAELSAELGVPLLEIPEGASTRAGRLMGGVPTLTGWHYDWPTWEGIEGPIEERSFRGEMSATPFVVTKGGGHGGLSSVLVGAPRLGHLHS